MTSESKIRIMFFLTYWGISFMVLSLMFSLTDRLRYFSYSPSEVLSGYIGLAFVVALCGAMISPSVAFQFGFGYLGNFIVACVTTFLLLAILAVIIGDLPGPIADRIPAIYGPFFSEWKFLTFIAEFAAPISVVSGAGVVLLTRTAQSCKDSTKLPQ